MSVAAWRSAVSRMAMFAVLLLVGALAAQAQTTGTISGVVTDKAGALVAKVEVKARNTASGEVRTAMSNAAGEYSFPSLEPGDYELTFALAGFATVVETATLNVTEHIAVNTSMQVSAVATTVEVSSAEPLLQTESVTQGALISGQNVSDLPLATNNFTQLLALSPGVIGPLNDATGLGRGTQNYNVNGARTNSNSIYVDGVDAVNVHTNSTANNNFASNSVIIPPPDAIQEIKVQTALFDATTGRSGGSNIALVTRTGTNAFHGDLFEFFRNTVFNANNYFVKANEQPRPTLLQNQFGASIGGPIKKDKIFFFFNYQGTRQKNGYSGITSVNLPQIPTDRSLASLGTFGTEMRRYQDNYFSNDDMRGTLDFISFQNFMLGLSGAPIASGGNGTGHSDIYEASVASGIVQRYDRIRDVALFAQDSWKPLQRVTLNLGLRWEYIGLPTDIYGRNGAFDPRRYVAPTATGPSSVGFVQAGNALHPVPGIAKVSNTLTDTVGKLGFAPRIGIAVAMTNRLVWRAGYGLFYDRLSNQLGLLESLSLPNYESSTTLNTAGSTSYFNTNGSLANPFPQLPTRSQFPILPQLYAQNTATSPAAIGIFDIDPKLRTPYYQQYGSNIQYQISRGFLLEVGYVGSRGEHLPVQTELDQAQIASATNPVNGVTTNNTGVTDSAAARAPYIGFSNSGFLYLQTVTESNFNSLQTTLTEKLGRATLLASYMYSKSMDTDSGSTDGTVFSGWSGDQTNQAQAYAPSDFNRTHHATLRFTQPLPKPHWRIANGATGARFFGGYTLSGTAVLQSGTPFSITNAGGATYYGTDTSRASFVSGDVTRMAVKHGTTENRLNSYFNNGIFSTTAGTVTQTDTQTGAAPVFATAGTLYGNTGRNILTGPMQRDLDLSLSKETALRDGVSVEFRAQAFNVTNTPNFSNPSGDIGTASTFGEITTNVGNPRILQFALKLKY